MQNTIFSTQFITQIELQRDKIASFEKYPFSLPVIKQLKQLKLHPKVTFFVGENGSGKSTLLEAIAIAWGFNPEGGSINFNFTTNNSHSELHKYLKLVKGIKHPKTGFFLRAESFYNTASYLDELAKEPYGQNPLRYYGNKSLHGQSHGESFLTLMKERFGPDGLYLLDEPEAALSPLRQMSALFIMKQLVTRGSQFIIATHSPILLAYPEAKIFHFTETRIQQIKYEETESYKITKDFLDNYKALLNKLLEEKE